jgi:hypothetical protein
MGVLLRPETAERTTTQLTSQFFSRKAWHHSDPELIINSSVDWCFTGRARLHKLGQFVTSARGRTSPLWWSRTDEYAYIGAMNINMQRTTTNTTYYTTRMSQKKPKPVFNTFSLHWMIVDYDVSASTTTKPDSEPPALYSVCMKKVGQT